MPTEIAHCACLGNKSLVSVMLQHRVTALLRCMCGVRGRTTCVARLSMQLASDAVMGERYVGAHRCLRFLQGSWIHSWRVRCCADDSLCALARILRRAHRIASLLHHHAGVRYSGAHYLCRWAVHAAQQRIAALPGPHSVTVAPAQGACRVKLLLFRNGEDAVIRRHGRAAI